jgi:hypothetical protein
LAKPSKDMVSLVWCSKKEMKIETQSIKGKLSVVSLQKWIEYFKFFSDYRILELYQTGLVEHWRKKYSYGQTSPCQSQKKNKSNKLRRLNLKDLASAFFILGLGISVSLLLFLVEQCRRALQHRQIVSPRNLKSNVIYLSECGRKLLFTIAILQFVTNKIGSR